MYSILYIKIKGLMVFKIHETFFDVWHRIPFISFHACIMLFLFDDAVVILLARLHGVRMS